MLCMYTYLIYKYIRLSYNSYLSQVEIIINLNDIFIKYVDLFTTYILIM